MVNVIIRMASMELYGDSVKSDIFMEILVKLIWTLLDVFMEKTWKIKIPGNLQTNFTIKSP